MAGISADQIYRMLMEDAEGRAALEDGWKVSWGARDSLRDRAVQIQRLSARIEQGWQGDAGGAAARGLGPIVTDLDNASGQHEMAQDVMNRQMNDFATARNNVMPVPGPPQLQDPAANLANAGPMQDVGEIFDQSTVEQQTRARNDAAAHNVQVYNSYYSASSTNTADVPRESPRFAMDQSPVLPPGQQAPAGPGAGQDAAAHHQVSGAGGDTGGSPGSSTSQVSGDTGNGGQVGAGQHGGGVHGGGVHGGGAQGDNNTAPEHRVAGSGTSAAAATSTNTMPEQTSRGGSVQPVSPIGSGDGSSTRTPGAGGAGGFGGAAGGGRIADVLSGRGSAAAGESAPGRGGGAAMGAGGSSAARSLGAGGGPGGAGAGGAAAAAAAGGRGGAGAGGAGAMPPGGAGGGKQDKEHKRKYSAEASFEETFGEDFEEGAPPVLGERKLPGEKKQTGDQPQPGAREQPERQGPLTVQRKPGPLSPKNQQ